MYKQSKAILTLSENCSKSLPGSWSDQKAFKINSVNNMLVFLYKMCVQPNLKYCVQVWDPYLVKDIHGLSHLSYENRLEKLDQYSLFCRRQRGYLIEVYKIINGYHDMEPSTLFILNSSNITRGHQLKLLKVTLLVQQHFFSNRAINLYQIWLSIVLFKQWLDEFWKQSIYGYTQRLVALLRHSSPFNNNNNNPSSDTSTLTQYM